MSEIGVKSERFGPISASITATAGVDGPIMSGFLTNRKPATGKTKAVGEQPEGQKQLTT
jgi:hypothetical protein